MISPVLMKAGKILLNHIFHTAGIPSGGNAFIGILLVASDDCLMGYVCSLPAQAVLIAKIFGIVMVYGISCKIIAVRNGVGDTDIIPGCVGASGSPAGPGAAALTVALSAALTILAASLTVCALSSLTISLTVSLTTLTFSLTALTIALTVSLAALAISLTVSLAILIISLTVLTLVGGKAAPPCGGVPAHLLQLICHSLQGLR